MAGLRRVWLRCCAGARTVIATAARRSLERSRGVIAYRSVVKDWAFARRFGGRGCAMVAYGSAAVLVHVRCCHCRDMADRRELAGPVNTRELPIHCRVLLRGSRMVPVVGLVRRDVVVRHERGGTSRLTRRRLLEPHTSFVLQHRQTVLLPLSVLLSSLEDMISRQFLLSVAGRSTDAITVASSRVEALERL